MTSAGHRDDGGHDVAPEGAPWWARPGGSPWDVPQPAPPVPQRDPRNHPDPRESPQPPAGHGQHQPRPEPAPVRAETSPYDTSRYDLNGQPLDTIGSPPRARRTPGLGVLLPLALVVALVAGLIGGGVGYLAAQRVDDGASVVDGSALGKPPSRSVERDTDSVAGVAANVLPSVVQIKVLTARGGGTGSGFVIKQDGHLLTNNHVVQGANGSAVEVTFQDGRTAQARVVGASTSYDLAVLKIDADNLKPLSLGNSESVVVGDPVIAIGSPLGLSGTVTSGIVSAKDRPVTAGRGAGDDSSYINAIQTDAAINPGNSGGPLVNLAGEVIGVNSAIATLGASLGGEGGNIGVGFAIPINQARRTADQIIETGEAQFPVIGASLDPSYDGPGARIAFATSADGTPPLRPGGPADRAGLEPGDVIVAIDDKPVAGNRELIVAIRTKSPGDRITLTIRRGSDQAERDVSITLGASKG